jgi:hypothetical protein
MLMRFYNVTLKCSVKGLGEVCPVVDGSRYVSSKSGGRYLASLSGELGEVCLHADGMSLARPPPSGRIRRQGCTRLAA